MKKSPLFVGIDISKKTLDICELAGSSKEYTQIPNDADAIREYLSRLDPAHTVVSMENTGRYNWALYDELSGLQLEVYVLSALHLKRSIGLVRGKNDRIDSYRIAWFTAKHRTELQAWEPESDRIRDLKLLLTERKQLVNQRKQVQTSAKERCLPKETSVHKSMQARDARRIAGLTAEIKEVEKELKELIKEDEQLSCNTKLIRSIPGVGPVLSWNLLAKTNGFSLLNDPRKLACYAGVAPFDYQSGSSLKTRPGVSNYADKQLKTL